MSGGDNLASTVLNTLNVVGSLVLPTDPITNQAFDASVQPVEDLIPGELEEAGAPSAECIRRSVLGGVPNRE